MKHWCFFALFFASRLYVAQVGVGAPGSYGSPEFSVSHCFKNRSYSGLVSRDSIGATHIMKGQQIWRSISLDNKDNRSMLLSSRDCQEIGLFEIIKFGLLEKSRNAFLSDNFNEAKNNRLTREQLLNSLSYTDTSEVVSFDASGNEAASKNSVRRFMMGSDVKFYLLKEDWIFNSYTGKTEKYVIGLAPLVYDREKGKSLPLFWLYYPEWRELFAAFEAPNFFTQQPITYDDVFTKHYFISQISKESNVFDRGLKSVHHGADVGLESELIHEKLSNAESDLFQY